MVSSENDDLKLQPPGLAQYRDDVFYGRYLTDEGTIQLHLECFRRATLVDLPIRVLEIWSASSGPVCCRAQPGYARVSRLAHLTLPLMLHNRR